jgi:hypothetical protein
VGELPRLLQNEILKRETLENLDEVIEELFLIKWDTDEWLHLESRHASELYDDDIEVECISPSAIVRYIRSTKKRDVHRNRMGVLPQPRGENPE